MYFPSCPSYPKVWAQWSYTDSLEKESDKNIPEWIFLGDFICLQIQTKPKIGLTPQLSDWHPPCVRARHKWLGKTSNRNQAEAKLHFQAPLGALTYWGYLPSAFNNVLFTNVTSWCGWEPADLPFLRCHFSSDLQLIGWMGQVTFQTSNKLEQEGNIFSGQYFLSKDSLVTKRPWICVAV